MSAFEQAVLADLESRGWKIGKQRPAREGVMYRANDGGGSTDAQSVLIKDSLASITFHRGAGDLPAPWRVGRDARDGAPTMYVTARDLGIRVDHCPPVRPSPPVPAVDPVDHGCVAAIRQAWDAKVFPRDNHPQFVKGGAWVHPGGLREFPSGHKHAGDLIAPLFRPTGPGALSIELCGAQQLLRDTSAKPDKYIVPGSRAAGAFVPLPLRESFFETGASLQGWIPDNARIVVTEGVRTGQAVRTACAGWSSQSGPETIVLAALSANNLPAVARWLKTSGLAAAHEVVIAADNDLGKSGFAGIRKAVEAAALCGGGVALADNDRPGFDAHDLMKERRHDPRAALSAVREFIDAARPPEQVRADRAEAFDAPKARGKESPAAWMARGVER